MNARPESRSKPIGGAYNSIKPVEAGNRAKVIKIEKPKALDVYPEGSFIQIMEGDREIPLLMPCCGGHSYQRTGARIRKLREAYPNATVTVIKPKRKL